MQFALAEPKPIQAGPDAPRHAWCLYCGMPVELYTQDDKYTTGYSYRHTSDLSTTECRKLRDREQEELNKVLNI